MPIKPIDLQTLFMQLNQVSREQAAAKEGAMLQQSIQGAVLQKKQDDEVKAVRRPVADEGTGKIRDRESRAPAGGEGEAQGEEGKAAGEEAESGEPEIVRDPNLGRRIDISG